MGGNPVFRGTRVPVHMLAELVPSGTACARTRYRRASVGMAISVHPGLFGKTAGAKRSPGKSAEYFD